MGRIQVVLNDELEKKFRDFLSDKGMKKGTISDEVEAFIRRGISEEAIGKKSFVKEDSSLNISEETRLQIQKFFEEVDTLEKTISKPLIIMEDKRIKAFYTECHISAKTLVNLMDLDPSIDPDYQEEFRSNRSFDPDDPDYIIMVEDAEKGRQFSDIVIEYNPSKEYGRPTKPLKVFGGQHRCHAIEEALKKGINLYHGIRIYFNLDKDQRGNIAIVSNKNIQVSNDLLDRMNEQGLVPPNKLRNFCYEIGILDKTKKDDFSSKRSENIITVGLMRTFIINFYRGKSSGKDFDNEYIIPILSSSKGMDNEYKKLYQKYDFVNQEELVKAGKEFVKIHKKQMENGKGKAKSLALTFSIASSWSFAAGLLQKSPERQSKFYRLPDLSDTKDPLKYEILSQARGDNDPPTYRGLITRYGEKERGRLLQLFLIYSKAPTGNINLDMIKLAIKDCETKEKNEERKKLAERVYKK